MLGVGVGLPSILDGHSSRQIGVPSAPHLPGSLSWTHSHLWRKDWPGIGIACIVTINSGLGLHNSARRRV